MHGVLVRGDDIRVSELGQGDLRVIVDLSDAHSGANLIALRTDEVVAPHRHRGAADRARRR